MSPIAFSVYDMPDAALSKVRYVGAWSIAKVFYKNLQYVKNFKGSRSICTQKSVRVNLELAQMLEDHVIGDIDSLMESSKYPATLQVTEQKQWRSRGLIHIEDSAFEFFLELEQFRVDFLNEAKLRQHREDLLDVALEKINNSESLRDMWRRCFPVEAEQVRYDTA